MEVSVWICIKGVFICLFLVRAVTKMKRSISVLFGSLVVVCALVIGSESSGIELQSKAYHDSARCSLVSVTKDITVNLPLQDGCTTERWATVQSATYNECQNGNCENYNNHHSTITTQNCCLPVPKAETSTGTIYNSPFIWSVKKFSDVTISGGCYSPGETEQTDVYVVNPTACQCVFLSYE